MLVGWICLSLINVICLIIYFIYRVLGKRQTQASKIGITILMLVWLAYSVIVLV